jgi:hypothetical protein
MLLEKAFIWVISTLRVGVVCWGRDFAILDHFLGNEVVQVQGCSEIYQFYMHVLI